VITTFLKAFLSDKLILWRGTEILLKYYVEKRNNYVEIT
jgi:hypothetical protein